jgi:hypothetical protein
MYNKKKLTILLIILPSLLISGCDLFTNPKVDLYKAISDEVDWAHSPKLNVRIDFPAAWGTSAPPQGDITPAKDIRKGYEFSVDFTPNSLYVIRSWQVFLTSDLETVSGKQGQIGNWLEDPSLIDEKGIEPLVDDVILPDVTEDNARGGTYKFTIYTTEPVTIVPWCDPQLRVTRTEPRNRPDGPSYSRASDIVIYFNGALDEKTVRFAESKDDNGIWITAKSGESVTSNDTEKWFTAIEYAAIGGFFTVTMNSGAKLPPEDSLMTVTVKGIESTQGDPMDAQGYSFSWKTSLKAEVNLISYNASYKDDEKSIVVDYKQEGAAFVKTYYRLNREASAEFFGTIENVPVLSDANVRNGRNVSNIAEYEIFIELYADGAMEERTSFKIWNFPGMTVSNEYPAIEITSVTGDNDPSDGTLSLDAIKNNLGGQYVLANDINIPGDWIPVGKFNNDKPELSFSGKFYGAGHTITLNGGFSGELCYGLFGCAQNAVIRDFTLEYNKSSPIIPNFGSFTFETQGQTVTREAIIIGSAAGFLINTEVCNIITSGELLAITAPSGGNDTMIMLGGVAGMVQGSGIIRNCRAALPVKYTSTGHAGYVGIGAITAMTNNGTGGNIKINNGLESNIVLSGLLIDGVTVAADVSAVKGSYNGEITIGGAVGKSGENTLNDITFISGKTVSFSRSTASNDVCGGIVGSLSRVNMAGCLFLGNIEFTGAAESGVPPNSNDGIWIGGLVGRNDDGNGDDNKPSIPGDFYFHNCQVRGNIVFNGASIRALTIGGIFGSSNKFGQYTNITMTDCFFEDGNITIGDITKKGKTPLLTVGGFIGAIRGNGGSDPAHTINNCGALQGQININVNGAVEAGGFTSKFSGTISKCFSRIDIIVESEDSGLCNVGGFIGTLSTGSINNCYATGTVSVVTKSDNKYQQPNYLSVSPSVGGLVGWSNGIIKDSYALGNVLLSDRGTFGPASAGGLAGLNWDGDISNCFSAGQVSAESGTNPEIYSGGIVGHNKNGAITNTAALGASITVRISGGGQKGAGRIYGKSESALNSSSKNYALNSMAVEEGEYGSTSLTAVTLSKGLNAKDGADTASSAFLNQAFWSETLGFSKNDWDFNRVAIEGYPRLIDVGGRQ